MTTRTLHIAGSLALLLATTGLASAQQAGISSTDVATQSSGGLSLAAGADYSTGKYGGTSSTDILYLPLTGKYEWDRWTFKLTVPFISVTGPGNVVRGVGIVRNKVAGPRPTESGVGDVIGGAAYTVFDGSGSTGTLVDVAGKVKFGTADGLHQGHGNCVIFAGSDGFYHLAACESLGVTLTLQLEAVGVDAAGDINRENEGEIHRTRRSGSNACCQHPHGNDGPYAQASHLGSPMPSMFGD